MMYSTTSSRRGWLGLKPVHSAAMILAAIGAGCSADVARFDNPSFNLNDPPQTTAAAIPSGPVRGSSDIDNQVTRSQARGPYGAGAGAMAPAQRGVEMAALPDASPVLQPTPPTMPAARNPRVAASQFGSQAGPAAAPMAMATSATASGRTIDVQPGDTLYGLSKKHHVSVAALMSVNQLTSPNLKLGQKLALPSAGSLRRPLTRNTQTAAAPLAPAPLTAAAPTTTASIAAPSADVAAKYNGTYTVKPGDSLYAIARAHKVNFAELQQVNGITDPRRVKPGSTLKIPGGLSGAVAAADTANAPVAAETKSAIASTTQPTSILNSGKQVAALNDKATDAQPEAAAVPAAAPAPKREKVAAAASAPAGDTSKLRWPASGKVIAGFGARPDGTHNDGINLSVPLGTEVHAAESGVVAYAGSELKGYGNLVLVRHDNGWVTAYAHNDELLVKRGDKVTRGQVIGKAGKTGTVDQPQVHFELRQGSKPVDPTPYMEKS